MYTLKNIDSIKSTYYLYESEWADDHIIVPLGYTVTWGKSTSINFNTIASKKKEDYSTLELKINIFNRYIKRGKIKRIEKKDFPLYVGWGRLTKEFTDILKEA